MLTHDEIMSMQAGPELDRHMAEFMGMPFHKPTHGSCCTCQTCGWDYDNCQCGYGEDIEMAFRVVEKLQDKFAIAIWVDPEGWYTRFRRLGHNYIDIVLAQAPTAPLAICRTALMTTIR